MTYGMLIAAGGGGLTDVNPFTFVWALISFGVTFFLLKKVAWPMLLDKMEEREVRIREGLEKAEEAQRKTEELLAKQETVLQEARDEAQKILAEGRAAAENVRAEAMESAQKEIAVERDRAKKEIALERAKAMDDLRQVAVDLTLQAAGRVLERELQGEDHRRLAQQVIEQADRVA